MAVAGRPTWCVYNLLIKKKRETCSRASKYIVYALKFMCFVSEMLFIVFLRVINFWRWSLLVCFPVDDDIRNGLLINRRWYISAVCLVILSDLL